MLETVCNPTPLVIFKFTLSFGLALGIVIFLFAIGAKLFDRFEDLIDYFNSRNRIYELENKLKYVNYELSQLKSK